MANKSGSKAGLGLAAVAAAGAAAAAGYYFYASKEAPKHRKIAAKWASDMKRSVIIEAKKLQNVDRAKMMKLVDTAAKTYAVTAPHIDKAALKKAVSELKGHWDTLRAEAGHGSAQKSAAKSAKKGAAKKTAKKTAKKSASKSTK